MYIRHKGTNVTEKGTIIVTSGEGVICSVLPQMSGGQLSARARQAQSSLVLANINPLSGDDQRSFLLPGNNSNLNHILTWAQFLPRLPWARVFTWGPVLRWSSWDHSSLPLSPVTITFHKSTTFLCFTNWDCFPIVQVTRHSLWLVHLQLSAVSDVEVKDKKLCISILQLPWITFLYISLRGGLTCNALSRTVEPYFFIYTTFALFISSIASISH